MKIHEILTIDLSEDIKNVIDLEDISDKAIQSEIENYIVTDGLAREYANFVDTYASNILETGVWISGFYGSGKSYFGKLLGYLLSSSMIAGTPARDRILQRFTGIHDEALVKNSMSRLNAIKSRVVFLDIAKQDTSKGFSFTLFRNFLRSLELPENEHGCFLYQLMLSEGQSNIHEFVYSKMDTRWSDIKNRLFDYIKACKEIYLKKGNTEADYTNVLSTIRRDIEQFSASRLKEELTNYIRVVKDEKIVFLFDEASEAINQKKINLLDLEGLSEALTSLAGSVWTIAIAQEKLDDVIVNSRINKSQLIKVTDRYKTKIHLESTEVDVIIRNRLLKKNDTGWRELSGHFKTNSGKIADHAAIQGAGVSKTDSAENYATYYPFYKYQFDLLQNFLFGTKGYASTKVAARGMIITTYDILKKEIQHEDIFRTVTGWHIAKEGQPQPPVRLVSRYDNAERILQESGSSISGRRLLETIHFLSEAEITPATLPNIIKAYIHPDDYYKNQEETTKALALLTEAKVLLDTNSVYRITSDIEQRLLDEMNLFTVQGFVKKKQLVSATKESHFVRSISKTSDNGLQFDFYLTTDNDDELTNPALKYLKVRLMSLYNISDNRAGDIDSLKVQHQNDKDLMWVIPNNDHFKEVDRLIEEVERITYLEQKYNNPNSEEGRILLSFTTAKGEKQKRLRDLVEESLEKATAIYLFNTLLLNQDNWQATLQAQQKQLIQNVYSKRLSAQLSDSVAAAVIKETNPNRLHEFFNGADFAFFDASGNFIGDNLKIAEELLFKTRNTFLDGATLEKELQQPPTGFTFGTVISSVAALMRAGKIIAKYNGAEKFSWRDPGVPDMFNTAREFRKASFKAVSKTLSALQKQELAQFLLDIAVDKYIGRRVDYNTNDFELVNAVRDTARHFSGKVTTLRNSEKEFDKLFPGSDSNEAFLSDFTGAVSEANYIDKAVHFLESRDAFLKAIQNIEKVEKFICNNLPKVKQWKLFVWAVQDELVKAAKTNKDILQHKEAFDALYAGDVLKNFAALQQLAQKVKDGYHLLFSEAMADCAAKYAEIAQAANRLTKEINALPAGLNNAALRKTEALEMYAGQRNQASVHIDADVKDLHSRFTYSEVLSFIELYQSKRTELDIIRAGLIKDKAPEPQPGTPPAPTQRKFSVKLPASTMKVAEYKQWLKGELQKLAGANDTDEIEIS